MYIILGFAGSLRERKDMYIEYKTEQAYIYTEKARE